MKAEARWRALWGVRLGVSPNPHLGHCFTSCRQDGFPVPCQVVTYLGAALPVLMGWARPYPPHRSPPSSRHIRCRGSGQIERSRSKFFQFLDDDTPYINIRLGTGRGRACRVSLPHIRSQVGSHAGFRCPSAVNLHRVVVLRQSDWLTSELVACLLYPEGCVSQPWTPLTQILPVFTHLYPASREPA